MSGARVIYRARKLRTVGWSLRVAPQPSINEPEVPTMHLRRIRGVLLSVLALAAVLALVLAAPAAAASSLETAASRASSTGRTIAFSLIGLALAVAAVVLVFKRDFKEAVGVFAIGIIAVVLASPVGLSVIQQTATLLFGS